MISNVKYNFDGGIVATIDGFQVFIPDIMENRHRAMIAEWEAGGGVIEPYAEDKIEMFNDKSPREFRDILIDEGILTDAAPDEVTLAIQQIPFDKERTKALNAWQNMTVARRDDPYINMIGAMFGYTPEEIDALWLA